MESLSNASIAPTREQIHAVLAQVIDPEIGVNIVDLGLVYDIDSHSDGWRIALTMTSPACPMGQSILDDVRAAIVPDNHGPPDATATASIDSVPTR